MRPTDTEWKEATAQQMEKQITSSANIHEDNVGVGLNCFLPDEDTFLVQLQMRAKV